MHGVKLTSTRVFLLVPRTCVLTAVLCVDNAYRSTTGVNPLKDVDVRALRLELNWTQAKLAERLGCSQATVAELEGGKKQSGPIAKLLQILEIAIMP